MIVFSLDFTQVNIEARFEIKDIFKFSMDTALTVFKIIWVKTKPIDFRTFSKYVQILNNCY